MVKAVTKKNMFNKGGVLCLLYFFILITEGDAQKLSLYSDRDINSPTFGKISIVGFKDGTLNTKEIELLTHEEWASFFSVSVDGAKRSMLGMYSIERDTLSFSPRFLPDPEVSYSVLFSPTSLGHLLPTYPNQKDISWVVQFDVFEDEVKQVTSVYPEANSLPSNILRFYVHFSQPADLQNPYDFIWIENEEGNRIDEPFVEMQEGLWSTDRKRLTLLIHPGRIKRNVGPNMTMGEVFKEGKSYRLIISKKWDMESDHIKSFTIGSPLRSIIHTSNWQLETPTPSTMDPLILGIDRLLDNPLAERLISIYDDKDNVVRGEISYNSEKSILTFNPKNEWKSTSYKVLIDSKLEDVAGNTSNQVFDVEGKGSKETNQVHQISFDLRN